MTKIDFDSLQLIYTATTVLIHNIPFSIYFYFNYNDHRFAADFTYHPNYLFNVNPYIGGESFRTVISGLYFDDNGFEKGSVNTEYIFEPINNNLSINTGTYKKIDSSFYFNNVHEYMVNKNNTHIMTIKDICITIDNYSSDEVLLTDYFNIQLFDSNQENVLESYSVKKVRCFYHQSEFNTDEEAYYYDCNILELELKLLDNDDLIVVKIIPFIDQMNNGNINKGLIIGEFVQYPIDDPLIGYYNTILLYKE